MERVSFAGAGEMGDRVTAFDWSATPIGAMATWSNSLLTAVGICLRSRIPIVLWWGPELTVIYNDAYRSVAGNKHPRILGVSGREAWGRSGTPSARASTACWNGGRRAGRTTSCS